MKSVILIAILFSSVTVIAEDLRQTPDQTDEWARYMPENCGLSLELPGQIKFLEMPIPDEVQRYAHYIRFYIYNGDEVVIVVAHASAKIKLPPKNLAEGVIKGIMRSPTVSDLNYSTEPSTESKAPVKGTYKQSGINLEIDGIAQSQEKHGWMVVGVYKQGNKTAQNALQRALSSIRFDGSPCPEKKEVVGLDKGTANDMWLRGGLLLR